MGRAIHVENLTKTFRSRTKAPGLKGAVGSIFRPQYTDVRAVDDISFEVEQGDILAFIGPNGAGKSTTIKLITGILYPNSGSITVLGRNPHKARRELAYRIGTVFGQKSQLWYHLPPSDSFQLLGSIYDVPAAQLKARIVRLTEAFEIGPLLDVPVRKLSLGQRIRCEIAASLLHEPDILFLDEPSIGLDVVVKQRIRDLILETNRERGTTIFLTSHDAGDIEKICRRALVVNEGKLVWQGSIKEMKYSLLNRRIIDVKVDEKFTIDIDGVTVLKQKDYSAKLEVDLKKTGLERVIQEIMRKNSIQDITISSTPMEEVITMIYSGAV
jgi:ABC-2 type transport system ATP-binding protein